MATEDEAGTYRSNVAGSSGTRHCDYFIVSLDLVEAGIMPTLIDEFPSAPRKMEPVLMWNWLHKCLE